MSMFLYSNILKVGSWSTRGCVRNSTLSSKTRTVCDCNHLTHFAILLSPHPPTFNGPTISLSFSVISYVGITVSVIAMAVTILIFCTLTFNKKNRYARLMFLLNWFSNMILIKLKSLITKPSIPH